MPFMKGPAPIRRTLKYLEAGKLIFNDKIKIFSVNYNVAGDHHLGAREFVFWYLPQIQYKNPNVQVSTFKNMTPSPFIRCFLDDGQQILVDIDSKTKEEVHDHLKKILCKSDHMLQDQAETVDVTRNPAHFGYGCKRKCICEIPGQVPCPAIVPVPKHWRGKYRFAKED